MIVYASRTGNIKSVISKLDDIECIEIEDGLMVSKPFIIFTYTDRLGDVPDVVAKFLQKNYKHLKGVICSGNTNFAQINPVWYCGAADKISQQYNVPVLHKIDLRGYDSDIQTIKEQYKITIEG